MTLTVYTQLTENKTDLYQLNLGHGHVPIIGGLDGMPAAGLQAPGQVLISHIPAWWDPGGSGLLRQVPAL